MQPNVIATFRKEARTLGYPADSPLLQQLFLRRLPRAVLDDLLRHASSLGHSLSSCDDVDYPFMSFEVLEKVHSSFCNSAAALVHATRGGSRTEHGSAESATASTARSSSSSASGASASGKASSGSSSSASSGSSTTSSQSHGNKASNGNTCTHCNRPGHHADRCVQRLNELVTKLSASSPAPSSTVPCVAAPQSRSGEHRLNRPTVEAMFGGVHCNALIDSGADHSIVARPEEFEVLAARDISVPVRFLVAGTTVKREVDIQVVIRGHVEVLTSWVITDTNDRRSSNFVCTKTRIHLFLSCLKVRPTSSSLPPSVSRPSALGFKG